MMQGGGTMYQLSETVFIAWGRNRELAEAVSAELKKHGISSIVGGEPGRRADDFIGKRVIEQMDRCSRAIILAKGNDDDVFRSNLMFEWGYLLARLRSGSILAILIESSGSGASDLHGFFAESLPDTIKGTAARAKWIVNKFRRTRQSDPFQPFDTLVHWARTKSFLENQIDGHAAPTPEVFSKSLVTGLISATYCHEIPEMERYLLHLGESGNLHSPYYILASSIVGYTKNTENLHRRSGPAARSRRLEEYRRLYRQFEPCITSGDPYVRAVALNYRGKCSEKKARLTAGARQKKELFEEAVKDFLAAEKSFNDMKLDENSHVMWLGYVQRNLARTYESLGQIDLATSFAVSALNYRNKFSVYLSNSPHANAMTKSALDAEYRLSVIDYAGIAGDSDIPGFRDIREILDDYEKTDTWWDKVRREYKRVCGKLARTTAARRDGTSPRRPGSQGRIPKAATRKSGSG